MSAETSVRAPGVAIGITAFTLRGFPGPHDGFLDDDPIQIPATKIQ